MHVIYRITYLPHLENSTPPYYYVGSKYNYTPKYFGSLASKQKAWYSGDMSVSTWWKFQLKQHPEYFQIDILESLDDISTKDLVLLEKEYHEKLGVLGDAYFNFAVATKNFVSCKKTPETIQQMSLSTKKFWSSAEGLEKKQRLSDRNRLTKSQEQLDKWKNPTRAMLDRDLPGRPKGSKDLTTRKKKVERPVKIGEKIYENAKAASLDVGIHPTNVRRKCRLDTFPDWSYI